MSHVCNTKDSVDPCVWVKRRFKKRAANISHPSNIDNTSNVAHHVDEQGMRNHIRKSFQKLSFQENVAKNEKSRFVETLTNGR